MGVSRADNSVKIYEICPLAIQNQISLMPMHLAGLVNMPCYLLKLSSGNENMGVNPADKSVKHLRILAIRNSHKHIASLVKIRCYLPALSS